MVGVVFNGCLGSVAEMIRDAGFNVGLLLLTAAEAEDALRDHLTLADMLAAAGNTEATDPSAGRKTAIVGTVTVDNVNNWVDADFPDQVFTGLAGAAILKAVTFYEEEADDAARRPMTGHDWPVTPDGSDVTLEVNAAGFYRAA